MTFLNVALCIIYSKFGIQSLVACMKPEDAMLREFRQSEKDKYVYLVTCESKLVNS